MSSSTGLETAVHWHFPPQKSYLIVLYFYYFPIQILIHIFLELTVSTSPVVSLLLILNLISKRTIVLGMVVQLNVALSVPTPWRCYDMSFHFTYGFSFIQITLNSPGHTLTENFLSKTSWMTKHCLCLEYVFIKKILTWVIVVGWKTVE